MMFEVDGVILRSLVRTKSGDYNKYRSIRLDYLILYSYKYKTFFYKLFTYFDSFWK